MAVVMLSTKLVESITWNIVRPLKEKADTIEAAARTRLASHAEFVWDHYTKQDQNILAQCNPEYLRMSDRINISIRGDGVGVTVAAQLSTHRPVKQGMVANVGISYMPDFPDYAAIIEQLNDAKALRNEAKDVEPKMKELCAKCGSLADLIKIFPSVQSYLDDATKKRLERKTERKKNKPKELPEDLAGSLVKSRIFQSTDA